MGGLRAVDVPISLANEVAEILRSIFTERGELVDGPGTSTTYGEEYQHLILARGGQQASSLAQ